MTDSRFYLATYAMANGSPVFRPAAVTKRDRSALLQWYLRHQEGREATRQAWPGPVFGWGAGCSHLNTSDFPYSTHPGGIWSERAVKALASFLTQCGDVYRVAFDGQADDLQSYSLFDCWERIEAAANENFNVSNLDSLEFLTVSDSSINKLPDVFLVDKVSALVVSEAFKNCCEEHGLTGIRFIPLRVSNEAFKETHVRGLLSGNVDASQKGSAGSADLTAEFERFQSSLLGFDTQLWLFLCEKIDDRSESFGLIPEPVRHFYASRYLEWEVANGGFEQAADNIPHLFEAARQGYLALRLPEAAALISDAQSLIAEGRAGESEFAELDSKVVSSGLYATEKRAVYALLNRESFERFPADQFAVALFRDFP